MDDDGVVQVTVPRWGSKREAREFAERERAWIEQQLQRLEVDRERRSASAAPAIDPCGERELRERASRELPPRLLDLAARPRARRIAHQHPQSALALGIVQSRAATSA